MESDSALVVSVNVSEEKGEVKRPVSSARLIEDYGIEGDVHGGSPVKQVSLLDRREIKEMERRSGLELEPGQFAENLTTKGLRFERVGLGTRIRIGEGVSLEVSQIGKRCHEDCVIKEKTGECIMPSKGIFARVVEGGTVSPGDELFIEAG